MKAVKIDRAITRSRVALFLDLAEQIDAAWKATGHNECISDQLILYGALALIELASPPPKT